MMTIRELEQDNIPEVVAAVLICRIFLKTATEHELTGFVESHTIDWELFYKIVRAHRIRPVVNKVLSKVRINEVIGSRLQADCVQLARSNFEYYRELLRLNGLFEQRGITAVPYKGCMFGTQFYNDINLREFSDVDFLIRPKIDDVDAITAVMEAAGYTGGFDAPAEFREFYFSHIREFKYIFYENGKRKFRQEFHSLLNDPVFDTTAPIPNEYLFADLQPATYSGSELQQLSPTKHVIAMLTHHGIREQWTSLKNVMDLAMAVQNGDAVDWEVVFESSSRYRYQKVLSGGLDLVSALFGVGPKMPYKHVATIKPWLQQLMWKHLHPTDRTWRYNFLLKLRAKDNTADKWRMIGNHVRYLVTPSILDYKFVRLPRPLFFLYVFVKPVRKMFGK